jgi:hypothetical protein
MGGVTPFQGYKRDWFREPRAAPWAVEFDPFGVGRQAALRGETKAVTVTRNFSTARVRTVRKRKKRQWSCPTRLLN